MFELSNCYGIYSNVLLNQKYYIYRLILGNKICLCKFKKKTFFVFVSSNANGEKQV